MTSTQSDRGRFFGLDPGQWPQQWRAAGALLLELPLLRRLRPRVPVTLREHGGGVSTWWLAAGVATPAPGIDAGIRALALAPERVLERQLSLPPLAPADLQQAVQLDVVAATPFAPEQTVWGCVPTHISAQLTRVDVAITARPQIEAALRDAGFDLARPPEIWVLPAATLGDGVMRPIVLAGYGEGERQQRARSGLIQRLVMLTLLLALLAALVVTPTALERTRARQARQSFAALQQQAAPQLVQREALMQRLERLRQVGRQLDGQLAMVPVLEMLTRAVPDGAWLTGLSVEGDKLVLNGQADDAAALVQRLAAEPGAHSVRLASPATRRGNASKETFIIELRLEPQQYSPASHQNEAAS